MTSPALVWAPTRTTVIQPPVQGIPLVAGDRGPDVASYQGYPNWDLVAAFGCRFAFTKATEDVDYVNPTFEYNWAQIQRVGLVRGAYHFARPERNRPREEVVHFLSHTHFEGHDMPVLDLESGEGDLHDWCLSWLLHCQSVSGRKALLYSGPHFMQTHNLCAPDIAAAAGGLWLAAYADRKPYVPQGWREVTFWQFTDKEVLPGISGGVDCNIYLP
jgi:lysozyme